MSAITNVVRAVVAVVALVALSTAVRPLAAQGTLLGTVREDSTARPIPSVEVSVEGKRWQARTDSVGAFRIAKVEPGVYRVRLRRIGYLPSVVVVRVLPSGDTRVDDFTLVPNPAELSKVTVTENATASNPLGLAAEGFEERRKLGLGKFIDAATLSANSYRRLPDVMRSIQGITVRPIMICPVNPYTMKPDLGKCRPDSVRRYLSGRSGCPMRVYLDNALVYRGGHEGKDFKDFDPESLFDISTVLVEHLAGVEVFRTASEVPGAYGGTGADCGVVLLWSRRQ